MLVKCLISEFDEGILIAQNGLYLVLEVELSEKEEIFEIPEGYSQRCLAGKYGEILTYNEIIDIRSLIEEYGDSDSYMGLIQKERADIKVQLKETQDAIIELDGGV